MKNLQQSLEQTAQVLNIDVDELRLWLEQHQGVTPYNQIQLLRLDKKHLLDPLSDEVSLIETKEGYVPFITIDGWAKLINEHPQFAGMSLREPQDMSHQLPEWMECTIYRNDRILPIVVKEYLEEVMTNHPSWQQMPRRMLRHRVIQQCARLAFGINASDRIDKSKEDDSIKIEDSTQLGISSKPKKTRTESLKEKLVVQMN